MKYSRIGQFLQKVKIPSKYFFARLSGIPFFSNWLNRNRLLVLTYHGIYDGPKVPAKMPNTFVHVRDMEVQLREIKRRYNIIEPCQLLQSMTTRSHLPSHSALITFDDGYESFHRLAFPLLQSLGIKTIVFVATQYVENQKPFYFDLTWHFVKHCSEKKVKWLRKKLGLRECEIEINGQLSAILNKMKRMQPEPRNKLANEMEKVIYSEVGNCEYIFRMYHSMSKDQLKQVVSEGIFLGGHTHNHAILTALKDRQAEREIIENKDMIESSFGIPCQFFAYPNGGNSDFSTNHKGMLQRANYFVAFSLTQRRSLLFADPMDISRFHVAAEDTLMSLGYRCSGINSLVPWGRATRKTE